MEDSYGLGGENGSDGVKFLGGDGYYLKQRSNGQKTAICDFYFFFGFLFSRTVDISTCMRKFNFRIWVRHLHREPLIFEDTSGQTGATSARKNCFCPYILYICTIDPKTAINTYFPSLIRFNHRMKLGWPRSLHPVYFSKPISLSPFLLAHLAHRPSPPPLCRSLFSATKHILPPACERRRQPRHSATAFLPPPSPPLRFLFLEPLAIRD